MLTDEPRRGYAFLRQPYREAAVRELAGGPPDFEIDGRFAAVVVDRAPFDLEWLGLAISRVRSAQPGARIVVAIDRPGEPVPGRAPEPGAATGGGSFDRLGWDGLVRVDGRICAVLVSAPSSDPPDQIARLLATAQLAVRLALEAGAADGSRVPVAEAEQLLARQIADQRRSEQALLTQLERLTDRPRPPQPPAARLRAVIRGSRLGPPARAVLHGTRRVTARLRRTGAALRRRSRAGH